MKPNLISTGEPIEIKTKKLLPTPLLLAASAMVWCGLNLHAQSGPTITNQPASQTNLPGTSVNFSVGVTGTGPFSYQWQFNGTNLPNNIITTVAGNGTATYAGDGGAATNASLNDPLGVALDNSGNLYIADLRNGRIRRVDTNGFITTVAGGGSAYPGDGGAATNANMSYFPSVYAVALDNSGNLFIADLGFGRIRKVDTNGIITTVAGNGTNSYSGDGGAATNASLYYPEGVACDTSGNLYIADTYNNRIRKVDTNGIITTVAGNGTATFAGDGGLAANASLNHPCSLAFDPSGNLYIADAANYRIRKVATYGIITTVAGNGYAMGINSGDGGAATSASVSPYGVACDASGNLYIADGDANRIRKVDSNGIITTAAGNGYESYSGDGGAATNASLNPSGAAFDASGNLYIADAYNNRIREIHFARYPTFTINNAGAINAGNYTVVITSPYGSVTSVVATLTVPAPAVITSQPASQIVGLGSSPSFSVAVAGSGPFGFDWYFAGTNLLQSGTNNMLMLPNVNTNNTGNYMVVVTNSYGSVTSQLATLTVALLPSVISQSASQTNLVGTTVSFSVAAAGIGPFTYQWQFNGTNLPNNIITTVAGGGSGQDGGAATNASLYVPVGVALDAFGNLFIADEYNNRIRKVDTNGIITTVAGNGTKSYSGDGGAATNASLCYPSGVAFDAFGDLYIADYANNRIRKVDTNGIITTVVGGGTNGLGDGGAATNASLYDPLGVALDNSGNLYIADSMFRIRKVDTNGIITTVAGNGHSGYVRYSGDGSAATNASINGSEGVACDDSGNLYIADRNNNRIRKVDSNGIITTVAGFWPSYPSVGGYSGDGGAATNASLNNPWGVAFDASGNLYIADEYNNRIRKVDTNGIITTVVGGGTDGLGDGGAATNASLYSPSGVAFDAAGNMYIADYNNRRIRKVLLYAGYPTLTLNNIGATNAGNYSVVITSPYGSVTNTIATLTVVAPPVVTTQPASQIAVAGTSPSLSVAVAGSGPFDYEWYYGGTNLLQSGGNSTLTLPNVNTNNAGNYTVVVTNSYGCVTSQVATLTVMLPPSVAMQPASQTNLAGTTVSFSVAVNGNGPFSYQWQFNGTNLPNNIITTVAGNGSYIYSGDGGAATNASLNHPWGVAFDNSGNLYIADRNNNRIRKVDINGIITTMAGNGSATNAGDGGAAINASFVPYGVAFDASGNLYIADQYNNRIRKVNTDGIITTVVGNGTNAYSGDRGAATNASLGGPESVAFDALGNLYIADTANNRIREVDDNGIITTVAGNGSFGYSGNGGAATNASFGTPSGVVLDASGNLYIADSANNCIRKVNTNGIIITVAGGGTGGLGDGGTATNASLYYPVGVALDAMGNLYIADRNSNRIRKVDNNDVITTVAGNGTNSYSGDGGAATNASFYGPEGVACDAIGNLYIADPVNSRIRKVLLYAGHPTFTINNAGPINAGNYTVVISSPYGSVTSSVAVLYMPPIITSQPVSMIAAAGTNPSLSVAVAGSGPFGFEWYFAGTNLLQSGTNSTLTLPSVSTNNTGNYTVVVTNNYGSVTSQVATLTVMLPPSVAMQPASQTNLAGTTANFSVAVNGTGPFTYQWQFNGTNLPNNIITTVAGNGTATYAGDGEAATNASLHLPYGVVFDDSGNLYIADRSNNRIREVDTNGIITTVAGNGTATYAGDGGMATNASLYLPYGVAFDKFGNLYIADYYNNRIRKVATNGIITTVAGKGAIAYSGDGGVATNASLHSPSGVAFDASGNLYIADTSNNRIRKVATSGIITTVAGNGTATYAGDGGAATNASLRLSSGVAFDASGNLYIADRINNRIRKVDTNGIITTVAGNGTATYAGDGGAATNASLYYPSGVAFDASGNLYIADYNNNRIRKVDTNGIITTVAGNGTATYVGDGGVATNASLYNPWGVAFDNSGNMFVADTSNNRIREVDFAGYPTFTINNIGVTNAGNYTVVISSPYGSITSSVASITIASPNTPPQIFASGTNFGFTTNLANQSGFGFNLNGVAGQTIVVDGSTDLVNWTPLVTNVVGGTPIYFFDPASTNFPGRFYRARLP